MAGFLENESIIQARNNGRIMPGFLSELESETMEESKKQWKNHGRILVRNLINNSGKKQWKNHGRILGK